MPEALIAKEGREAFANHPIGTGPYKFVGWLADDHLDLVAWDGFWGDKPAFTYVHLESIPNGATRLASLLSGQIQVAEKIDPADFQRVKNSGKAYISLTPGQRTMYLAMDYWRETGSPGMPAGAKNPFMDPARARGGADGDQRAGDQGQDFQRRGRSRGAVHAAWRGGLRSDTSSRSPTTWPVRRSCWPRPVIPKGFAVRLDGPNDRYLEDSLVEQAIGGLLEQAGIKVKVNSVPEGGVLPAGR